VESWFDWYVTYEELPIELKEYIEFIERVEVPLKLFLWGQTENKLSSNKIKNALKFQGVFNYSKPLHPIKNI
jgi:hypothetical protein